MKIAWLGSRLWEAESLQPWLPLSFSMTLERTQNSIPGVSLESIMGERRLWGSECLSDPRLQAVARASENMESFDYVISYAPRPSHGSWPPNPLWTTPPQLLHLWADKWRTRRWLSAHGLPVCPSVEVRRGEWSLFSGLIVLQAPGGSCGTSTYMGAGDVLRQNFETSGWPRALVSPLLDGWVINGHIAVFPDKRVEVPWPSIQLVSAALHGECVQPCYAGNDFLAFQEMIPAVDRHHIKRLLRRLGELAAQEGYLGMLGADLLYCPADQSVVFLEVNARLQGSTGLLSKLEAHVGFIPTAVRTFYTMLGRKVPPVRHTGPVPTGKKIPVCQYLLRKSVPKHSFLDVGSSYCYGKSEGAVVRELAVSERILTTIPLFLYASESAARLVHRASEQLN